MVDSSLGVGEYTLTERGKMWPMSSGETQHSAAEQYDVALSFAEDDRPYVSAVADALRKKRIVVFYDADHQIPHWGKPLLEELTSVFGERAKAVVVFVSQSYAQKTWTRVDRRAAMNRAMAERREFLLPACFDDTRLDGVLSGLGYIELQDKPPDYFALMLIEKLAQLGIVEPVLPPSSRGTAHGSNVTPLRNIRSDADPARTERKMRDRSARAERSATAYRASLDGLELLTEPDVSEPERPWSRRRLLLTALSATAGTAGALTAATMMSRHSGPAVDLHGPFGPLTCQLDSTHGVEFAGQYIALTSGFYRDAHFAGAQLVEQTDPPRFAEHAVTAGSAVLGLSAPDITAEFINQGLPVRIVGAQYQKYPWAISYLMDNPIGNAQDLIRKRIGVSKDILHFWYPFLEANRIRSQDVEVIDTQDPSALAEKRVDGILSHVATVPISLILGRYDAGYFLLADNNYPLVSKVYVASASAIKHRRGEIAAALSADIRGWQENLADPAVGVRTTMSLYGKNRGLNINIERAKNNELNKLATSIDTTMNGLFTITPELAELNVRTLSFSGVKINAAKLFDLSILEELYKTEPSLKGLG
jgi:ABC-type nitrate/sulfonate/bicarbonate transport system substrate-binding protein